MSTPTNLNFSTPGAAPGTAAGWKANISNSGVILADFRGTLPGPTGFEGFDHDWGGSEGVFPPWVGGEVYSAAFFTTSSGNLYQSLNAGTSSAVNAGPSGTGTFVDNPGLYQVAWLYVGPVVVPTYVPDNQDWSGTILLPSPALFDATPVVYDGSTYPGRPGGQPIEDFSFNWLNDASLGGTTPLRRYDLVIDQALGADFCAATPPEVLPTWAPATVYGLGQEVLANGGVWLVVLTAGAGRSAAFGIGPIRVSGPTYLDNRGTNQITWLYLSATANPPASPVESFANGWLGAEGEFPPWEAATAYLQGDFSVSNGNVYQALNAGTSASLGPGPSGTSTFIDNPGSTQIVWGYVEPNPTGATPIDVGSIYNGDPVVFTLAAGHGVQTGQPFEVFVTGVTGCTAANGLWSGDLAATATGPTTLSLPTQGNAAGSGGQVTIQTTFDTLFRPASWETVTPYGAAATVLSRGYWYQANAAGLSGFSNTGPVGPVFTDSPPPPWAPKRNYVLGSTVTSSGNWYTAQAIAGSGLSGLVAPVGTGTFVDGQVTWAFEIAAPTTPPIIWTRLRAAPVGPLYGAHAAVFGADPVEYFEFGWDVVPYYTMTPYPPAVATFYGYEPGISPSPALVGNSALTTETFTPLLQTPIMIALVDTSANLISLAPGKSLPDGAHVTFAATPPYSAYSVTYPLPIVPAAPYIVWNAAPALGLNRLNVGDDSTATSTTILETTSGASMLVTTTTPHGLISGCTVFIANSQPLASINGVWVVTVLDATHFTIPIVGGSGLVYSTSGFVTGPITPVVLQTTGAGQLTLVGDPAWDWPAPG